MNKFWDKCFLLSPLLISGLAEESGLNQLPELRFIFWTCKIWLLFGILKMQFVCTVHISSGLKISEPCKQMEWTCFGESICGFMDRNRWAPAHCRPIRSSCVWKPHSETPLIEDVPAIWRCLFTVPALMCCILTKWLTLQMDYLSSRSKASPQKCIFNDLL